jgi:mannose-6-phosphate isomerase-like protein (cupin superfamily)
MQRIEKPWGWYETIISESPTYKVKRIYVAPEEQFSLQFHNNRNETWVVVEGSAKAILDDLEREVVVGNILYVPKTTKHRLKGGKNGVLIIEIQEGQSCEEEDIVRLEDDYGRV